MGGGASEGRGTLNCTHRVEPGADEVGGHVDEKVRLRSEEGREDRVGGAVEKLPVRVPSFHQLLRLRQLPVYPP